MRLGFYGAAKTVTGSKHLIEVNNTRILLDCGLFQGHRDDTYDRNLNFAFDPATVDVMVLSHAHIDHSGNIPNLVKRGFRGDIVCTPPTRDLCATMLADSAHIQVRSVEYVNKRRKKRGEAPVDPLYTQEDVVGAMAYFVTQAYGRKRIIAPDVELTFYDAGHMLGSAIVQLDIFERETDRQIRLVFSGDLGRKGIPIIRDPSMIGGADVLIMESTYGNRLHEPYPDAEKEMERIVNETYKRDGSIVMPAFAVGRTQQIVYTLHRLMQAGDIPRIPIYVDSPLAVNTTSVFGMHPEVYDAETRDFVMELGRRDPFGFSDLTYIQSVEESKQLNFHRDPCIIISASGMAEFGRVVHHLKNRIEDNRNTVLITGWQAPHTLGRRMVEKQEVVRIFGEEYRLNAHVEVLNGFSGHADRDELLTWVKAMSQQPQRTFLVHGEEDSATALAETLRSNFGLTVDIPDMDQQFVV
jgi:metallo-beta-lactamase family protein